MTVQKLTYPSKENAVQEKINEIIDNLGGGGGSVDIDNLSITENASNQLQTVGVINQNNTSTAIKTWTGTLAQYNALKPFPLYAWVRGGVDWYTLTAVPSVGDYLYQSDGVTTVGIITQYDTSPSERIIVNGFSHGRDASADTYSPSHIDSSTLYNITDDTDVALTVLEVLYPVGSTYTTTASTCPLANLISGSTWVEETCRVLVEKGVSGTEWYNLYSDGWCEQGGLQTLGTDGYGTVIFSKAFIGTDYSFLCDIGRRYDSSAWHIYPTSTYTTSTMQLRANLTGYTLYTRWQAEGYTSTTTNHKRFRRTA